MNKTRTCTRTNTKTRIETRTGTRARTRTSAIATATISIPTTISTTNIKLRTSTSKQNINGCDINTTNIIIKLNLKTGTLTFDSKQKGYIKMTHSYFFENINGVLHIF